MRARIRFRQLQVFICTHSSRALIRPRPPVKDVPGQGVELLDLEQAAPDPAAQFRLREVLDDELGLEDEFGQIIPKVSQEEPENDLAHDGKTSGELVVRAPWLTQGYLKDHKGSEKLWA